MKLLLYSHFFAPSFGGVETVVLSLARGLSERRDARGLAEFEVTVVTQTPAGHYDDSSLPFRVVRRPGHVQLWRLIRSCDVAHVAGPALAPVFLARLARKPYLIEHHGYQAICPNGLLFHHPANSVCPGHFQAGNYLECMNCNTKIEGRLGALRLLASTFLRRAGSCCAPANIAPSHHVAARLGLPRTAVTFHGVADPFAAAKGKKEAPALENSNFAYVGRLVAEKGVSVLLEAVRLLRAEGRAVKVLIIGDGPERVRLEKRIAASHLEPCIRITGFLSGEALEQMARGRLVIASAVGGLKEIVEGAGLVFPPGDSLALADTMRRVLDEPGLASSLAALGRQRVLQTFSFETMIDAHAGVYRRLYP